MNTTATRRHVARLAPVGSVIGVAEQIGLVTGHRSGHVSYVVDLGFRAEPGAALSTDPVTILAEPGSPLALSIAAAIAGMPTDHLKASAAHDALECQAMLREAGLA